MGRASNCDFNAIARSDCLQEHKPSILAGSTTHTVHQSQITIGEAGWDGDIFLDSRMDTLNRPRADLL
ncbi:MAG: hypothetical protein JMM78_03865 [Candidatus Xiphinematobacter sp.]|nr:MAG: hypothetical protein JMM78_03865 [Candidatus Xiphinematobacter sp.]